jgi:protein associated with RNAse G/E
VAPAPGELVQVRFAKWGGGRHWEFPVTVLGTDEYGVWGGGAVGTWLSRPGRGFASRQKWVTLFPHDRPWSASFYEPGHPDTDVYVDMTTVPVWDGAHVSLIDLDLDVILLVDGCLILDDQDEFEQHQVALGYPAEVVDLARLSADEVLTAVGEGHEPFLTIGPAWLDGWCRR